MTKTTTLFSTLVLACLLFACQKTSVTELAADGELSAEGGELSADCRRNPPPVFECGAMRTQTPGGWGAKPSGNNPGSYLHAHFAEVFPDGLTVGCYPGNNYVRLTSARAVTNLLPTGGRAALLTNNYTNPSSLDNVLVGHLVALKLSVYFDAADASFAPSDTQLGNMIIGDGRFAGLSVLQFLDAAEQVLGRCSDAASANEILRTAAAINENYVDGRTNKGFLDCPGPIIED